MDISHPSTLLFPAAMAGLVGWRMYSRIKRLVGRQRLSRVRPWFTVSVFPLIVLLIGVFSLKHPNVVLGLVGGVVVGIALGIYGLRLTKYDVRPDGLFYTPSAHLGLALSLLLVGRIVYRMFALSLAPAGAAASTPAMGNSPLTMLLFGTLAGYYTTYAVGLLRWKRAVGLVTDDVEGVGSDPVEKGSDTISRK